MLRFRSVIEIRGINPFVHVDAKRAMRLKKNWRKALPVLVRVNGRPEEPWRINMMPVGDGSFYLYLHEDVRKASRTKVGDHVTVELSFDHTYRSGPTHPLPRWFSRALNAKRKAKEAWDELSPSRKKEVLRYLSGLKSRDVKERNLKRVMGALSGNEVRFMARTWKGGK